MALSWLPVRMISTAAFMLVIAAAGVIGDLVYWSIAGISAGDWRGPKRTRP